MGSSSSWRMRAFKRWMKTQSIQYTNSLQFIIQPQDQQVSTPRMQQMKQQWDSNPHLEYNPISHSYSQGRKVNTIQSLSQERMKNVDPKLQSHEKDMEIGYEDNRPCKLTFEGLEQKLLDEMMKIINNQNDLENEEIARHKQGRVGVSDMIRLGLLSDVQGRCCTKGCACSCRNHQDQAHSLLIGALLGSNVVSTTMFDIMNLTF